MYPATISLLGCDSRFYLGIKVTLFDPETVKETGFFLTIDQSSWEHTAEEKKAKGGKQDFLNVNYKLPDYIKGAGGDFIFKQLSVKSRKEIAELQAMGHEIRKSIQEQNVEGSQLSQKTMLGDMSLYWPCPYGSGWTCVDFFPRDPNMKAP